LGVPASSGGHFLFELRIRPPEAPGPLHKFLLNGAFILAFRLRCAVSEVSFVYFGGTYGSGVPGLIAGYFWNEARCSSKICPAGYRTQKS
jgi:hypothetical protein